MELLQSGCLLQRRVPGSLALPSDTAMQARQGLVHQVSGAGLSGLYSRHR